MRVEIGTKRLEPLQSPRKVLSSVILRDCFKFWIASAV